MSVSFAPSTPLIIRRRIEYAYRVYCAVYGVRPPLRYGHDLPALYRARPLDEPAGAPQCVRGFPCFHGVDAQGEVDWLAEIFEWLSGAHEFSTRTTDNVGRIEYGETLHGRYLLNPRVPYAALAMRRLSELLGLPAHPCNPWNNAASCVIAATHDVDFLPVGFTENAQRLLKDLAIAGLVQRDLRATGRVADKLRRLWRGDRTPLHTLGPVAVAEHQRGIRSSWYLIARQAHRRDATYDITHPDTARQLAPLLALDVELGVHGSYTSLAAPGRLAEEYETLRRAGYRVVGGRQHWLRYRTHCDLMPEVAAAGGRYDCSLGYRTQPGFRHGACFPFPPYNFDREEAFPVLELPLVLMDTTLEDWPHDGSAAAHVARQVMNAVRDNGWGGVSILWHDTTFGGAPHRRDVAELYWQLKQETDAWLPAAEIVELVWPRYSEVGLLPKLVDDAPASEGHASAWPRGQTAGRGADDRRAA